MLLPLIVIALLAFSAPPKLTALLLDAVIVLPVKVISPCAKIAPPPPLPDALPDNVIALPQTFTSPARANIAPAKKSAALLRGKETDAKGGAAVAIETVPLVALGAPAVVQ